MSLLYDHDGHKYKHRPLGAGEILVRRQVHWSNDSGSDPRPGVLVIKQHSELLDSPPQDGVDGAFSKLRATRDSLREEIDRRRREIDDFDKAEAARMDRIKRHEALELLDEFLQGKITHYVLLNYVPPKIIAFVDSDPDDGVTWHDQSVRPCTSWSQAVDVVRLEDKARRAEISELTARIAKLTGLS